MGMWEMLRFAREVGLHPKLTSSEEKMANLAMLLVLIAVVATAVSATMTIPTSDSYKVSGLDKYGAKGEQAHAITHSSCLTAVQTTCMLA